MSSEGKESENATAGEEKEQPPPSAGNSNKFQDEDVYGPSHANSWSDIKEYDEQDSKKWTDDKAEKIAKACSSPHIVLKNMSQQPGRIGYYCELCCVEMNSCQALDQHCNGMKHKKRLSQQDGSQENTQDDGEGPPHEAPNEDDRSRPESRHYQRPPYDRYDRRQHGREPYARPTFYRDPPPKYRNDERYHYNQQRNYYDWHPDRPDRPHRPDRYYDDYYDREPLPHRHQPNPEPYENRRHSPYPERRPYGDLRNRNREDPERYSHGRFSPYEPPWRVPPPPPTISKPTEELFGAGKQSPSTDRLSEGPCGVLLKRLTESSVKNREDATLATNVVVFLIKSMKDYYTKNGPGSIVHVLDETNVRLSILMDLQKCPPPASTPQ